MSEQKELHRYGEFVTGVTSDYSLDVNKLIAKLVELNQTVNIAQLMTGAIGMNDESGEFLGIVKKILFQGKPLTPELIVHMKKELGDVMFYIMEATLALGIDPYEVIEDNVDKLQARFPGGKFSIYKSENRDDGDV